ncbi:MAG: MFS transporter [Myxococcota bacterium]|jgi:MFS family permease|nr:MFS transporter [Planctomycetota bacterium]MDP6943602.1 MFS transporter [Myxococcota bacterium]
MTDIIHASDLTDREKRLLFWASFFSLMAAGVGFAFRVALGGKYGAELGLTEQQTGEVFGASLWPIAITMIGFSLVVDRTGYRMPMYGAFLLQAISGVGTFFADSYGMLYVCALCAGLGHGIIEAVINPICAAVYPKDKTKWLTILHAAWPAGLAGGTLLILGVDLLKDGGFSWQFHALWILLPAAAYALMYGPCKFPVDERVQAGIPYKDMLRQVGFLTAALASFLLVYEIGNQCDQLTGWTKPEGWFNVSLGIGLVIGLGFGLAVRSMGRPLFFLMCLLMIPVATAELGTDGWIRGLMEPVLDGKNIPAAMALVFSASIMLVLRVFAGGILKYFSPPGLLFVSGIFSAIGLYWLSSATGAAIFIAFVLYALGQTYYWPCVLGFTSERYPQGGALTLNTVSAIGLLSAGIIGTPILGVAFDESIHATVVAEAPALAEAATTEGGFMWMSHEKIDPAAAESYLANLSEEERTAALQVYSKSEPQGSAQASAGRNVLLYAVRFPALLMVVFGIIALYFRMRGGYKPIELDTHSA